VIAAFASLWLSLAAAAPDVPARLSSVLSARPSLAPALLGARKTGTPSRIVSVAPSTTEIIFALEAGDRVVGVSRYDDYPERVQALPKVGGFIDPSVEAIVALHPDLVVAVPNAGNRPALERVAAMGTPVVVVPGNSIADVFHAIRGIAPYLGPGAEQRAEALILRLTGELAEIAREAEHGPPMSVAFVYGASPLVLAGPGSFADAMLQVLNAKNVAQSGGAYVQYSMEKLVLDAPEVIIDATEGHGGADERWSRFPSIPAVKSRRVYRVGLGEVLRAGPRIAQGMRRIASLLRPTRAP
jgi:iron complex transport system substrate-binding protein